MALAALQELPIESANGEISRNWTAAAAGRLHGRARRRGEGCDSEGAWPPSPPRRSATTWKHVKKLYGSFNQSLLWLDDKGVHQPRVSALLHTLANADSDALRLDDYPLAEPGPGA